MPIQTHLSTFDLPVIAMGALGDHHLALVTAEHQIYTYDLQSRSAEKIVRLNVPPEKELLYAFDPVHKRIVFGDTAEETLFLVDVAKKKILHQFKLDGQSPTSIAYAPGGVHFVCGTNQGRVLLWRSDSNSLIARLHSFPEYTSLYIKPKNNFVSALCFDGEWLATSGYGGSVVVTDYQSQIHTKRYHPSHVRNTALAFFEESIITGNQDGSILKIDRNGKVPNQRLSTTLKEITHLYTLGVDPYMLAVSRQRYMILFNAQTMKAVNERYIELSHPVSTVFKDSDGQLYVATANNDLFVFDLDPIGELESLIEGGAYAKAFLYCESEPLLQGSAAYGKLEAIFQAELEMAQQALENNDPETAKTLLRPFAQVKGKAIANLFGAFAQFKKFTYLFDTQKYSPFYGLAEQYPLLQTTKLYQKAEEIWTQHFIKAQKYALLGKDKEAKNELQPYLSVNAKYPFIQLLIQHSDILHQYSKAVQTRNYAQLYDLTHRQNILRKFPSYTAMINEAGELAGAITQSLKDADFDRAELLLQELSTITQYQDDFRELKRFYTAASNLHHAINNRHLRSAYRMIDSHQELMILPWAQELENRWQHLIKECESFAIHGDVASIKTHLGALITIPQRNDRIGVLFRLAYQVQLKELLRIHNDGAFLEGVNRYCELFGKDTELHYLLKVARRRKVELPEELAQCLPKKWNQWVSQIANLTDSIA